ncbi:uncharacterized protein LOC117783024 [Drosophila innubila]|uniref:uncharacterized protein LOC117783024 n=1 Tax=Drosophila innubila TaxID=198719 RepID=UPI00148C025A|nr:uncharacterized protein LOC117783024 [Drosophila innubila]
MGHSCPSVMLLATLLPLLSLLLLATWQVHSDNLKFVQSILRRVADEDRWTNTPIFMSRPLQLEEVNHLIKWLHSNLSVTSYIFDATGSLPDTYNPLRNHIKNDVLSLLFCHSSDEIIFLHMDEHLRKLRGGRLIVYLSTWRHESALPQLFHKLWKLQFVNALVLHKKRVYVYTPYPTVRYFQLNLEEKQLLFPAAPRDLKGYVVSTPAENDLPRVFFVRDPKTGAHLIRGFGYRIFAEFLRRHNAQLVVSNAGQDRATFTSVDTSRINQMIGDDRLEISMHPYVGIDRELGILSYPLTIAQNCLIVPVRNEIPRYMYLLRPFQWSSWLLLLGGVFYISFTLYWLNPGLNASPGLSLLEALCQLLFLSSPSRIYGPSVRYFLVALQLSVLGFIVTNVYSNQLSSSLTATLVGEQVDTFEQLIAQRQHILTKHHEIPMLLQQVPPHLEQQVSNLVVGAEAGEQVRALLSFNTSYSYPFTVERWEFFALQQQYAQKPIYRYSSVCLGAPVIGYPMRKDSHLENLLKQFIMWVQSTGLFQYWVVSDFNDALRAGYVRLIDNSDNFKALNLDTLRLAWYVLLCGWLLAALVFICEHRTTCH